jgi:hypothetical protein
VLLMFGSYGARMSAKLYTEADLEEARVSGYRDALRQVGEREREPQRDAAAAPTRPLPGARVPDVQAGALVPVAVTAALLAACAYVASALWNLS